MRTIICFTLSMLLCAATLRADERILNFPVDRAIGVVYVRDRDRAGEPPRDMWTDWVRIGPAQGQVRIPSGKVVRFDAAHESTLNLAALTALNSDDIDMFFSTDNVGGVDLASVAHLTGLRVLVMRSTTLCDKQLSFLGKLALLEELALGGSPITDGQLKYLQPLGKLRLLELWQTKVTDAGLSSLAKIASLEDLNLASDDVGDKGMASLLPLTHLRRLAVEHTDVGDAGLTALSGMSGLQSLDIQETPVTDKGMAAISKMQLKKLYLRPFNTIDDTGMESIGKITTLETLWLPSKATDAGVRSIANLKSLKSIEIPGHVTDASVAVLAKLPALESVSVGGTAITDAGLSQLASLPHLKELSSNNLGPITLEKLAAGGSSIESLMFDGRNLKPDDLKWLVKLPHLKRVYPMRMDLRGDKIDGIAAVKTLEFIEMFEVQVDDGTAAKLGTMPALKNLLLPPGPRSEITNAGVKGLSAARALVQLDLFGNGFNDETLALISNMKEMQTLQTFGDFTDAGLAHLEGMPQLEGLYISVNKFTPRAIDRMRQTTPSLQHFDTSVGKPKPAVTAKVGNAAPDFEIKTFDGKTITGRDLMGKVVILHFWATWCAPCMASTDYVKKMYEDLSQNPRFAMISVSLDDDDPMPKRHAQRHQLTWPQTSVGIHGKVADDFGIEGVATLVVIGAEGKILAIGSYDEARDAAKKALQAVAN